MVADCHSLRKTFITNLSRAGVSPKMAQSLARHSDINLAMNVYTMVNVSDQAAAVDSLPPLPGMPHTADVGRPKLCVTA
jgi:integrase